MKKWLPLVIFAVFAGWIVSNLAQPSDKTFAFREFGSLPILAGGRRQPIDSLARNSLLQLRGKQTANYEPWKSWTEKPKIVSATEWLAEVLMNPALADSRPVFRIDHPDLKGLLGLPLEPTTESDAKHFSWMQISPKMETLLAEMKRVTEVRSGDRTPFDTATFNLWKGTFLYQQLKAGVQPPNATDWGRELGGFLVNLPAGREAAMAERDGKKFDKAALDPLVEELTKFDRMEKMDEFGKQMEMRIALFIPPAHGHADDSWQRTSQALMEAAAGSEPNPALLNYGRIATAFRTGDAGAFNAAVAAYRGELAGEFSENLSEAGGEQFFNHAEFFYKAMLCFVCAFLFAVAYWFKPVEWDWLRRSAAWLMGLAVIVTMVGIIFRMELIGRPPVINLYSSATFIAWGAACLGLLLERFWRNSIGIVVGSTISALSLIIAHYLSLEKDTLEMLRAVLDTNFWLATHVVVVTLGYASTFVAGFLGIVYVVRGFFTDALGADLRRSLARMVYGIVCFAALFSFIGTVLGGIWADQSWGRFWGWDPKENGAVIIVLWNALILHARWGGMVRERGLMNLAIGGNIVTSWSWFGVNMLGIGLHSYGFMDSAFRWLIGFVVFNLALIALGMLPARMWRSMRSEDADAVPGAKPVAA